MICSVTEQSRYSVCSPRYTVCAAKNCRGKTRSERSFWAKRNPCRSLIYNLPPGRIVTVQDRSHHQIEASE